MLERKSYGLGHRWDVVDCFWNINGTRGGLAQWILGKVR